MPVVNINTEQASLLRIMQLSSASLPVGGYAFSQGLEYAVEAKWINNAPQVSEWLQLMLNEAIARVDLPLLIRLINAVQHQDQAQFHYWNATVLACRETQELLLTETAMGAALLRLLQQLDNQLPIIFYQKQHKSSTTESTKISFIAAFALAAVHWQIDHDAILIGYLWSWLENQVAAATKLVPLGQSQAQALLLELSESGTILIDKAKSVNNNDIGTSLPGLAMASAWHETQYSRLFRS